MALSSTSTILSFLLLLLTISPSTSRSLTQATQNSNSTTLGPIKTLGQYYRYVCDPARFAALKLDVKNFAYCNKNLSYYDRVDDLIGRMSLDEKVNQTSDYANGVERIGLPEYKWWSEILHGVSTVGETNPGHATWFDNDVKGATQFPEVINSAASFNESLWKAIAQTASTEARAMYNLGHSYLTFWSPVINIPRDPRWGRIMETPGEDPYVSGRYSVNFVRGLQDVEGSEVTKDLNTRPIKVASCCKHFAAYDLDSWLGIERFNFDAKVTEQDMEETFNPPFEMCITEGDSTSAMCSYNQVNGIPACANPKLLKETIRDKWNLHGYVVSDCYIYNYLHDNQKWLNKTKVELVAEVINAGLDLECGWEHHYSAQGAVLQGKLKEKEIDRALKNLYIVLMRVGFFDGMEKYDSLGKESICSDAHMELAADAARQGMVLLKNIQNTLPLNNQKHKNIAMGGTHANATVFMKGNYCGVECRYVTPLDGIKAQAAQVEAVLGCDMNCINNDAKEQMKNASRAADATILVMGISTDIEAEFKDRTDLLLPPGQTTFIQEVAEASKNPIILVLLSAGGIDVSFAKDNPKVGAILWAGYPGEEGGQAIADVVYGHYNPGGKLPITWYPNNYTTAIPMTSMQFRPDPELGYPGRTYKFYDGPVVYPFGYGLSYTQLKYSIQSNVTRIDAKLGTYQQCLPITQKKNVNVPICASASTSDMPCNEQIEFDVKVENTGTMDGSDAIIVYVKPPSYIDRAPIKQVVAFQRVFVPAGRSEVVKFSINVCRRLSVVEKTAYRVLVAGQYTIMVGNESNNASFPLQVKLSN